MLTFQTISLNEKTLEQQLNEGKALKGSNNRLVCIAQSLQDFKLHAKICLSDF